MSGTEKPTQDRRTFLKIGAGVVGGLVIGGAVGYLGGKGSGTTSTTTTTVTGSPTVSTITSTIPGTAVTSTVTSTVPGTAVTSTVTSTETSTNTVTADQTATTVTCTSASSSAQSQITALQTQIATVTGFLNLNTTEQAVVEAMAETIIPTDSNGPGAKEAGVIYFIDRQLASDYGKNAQMYFKGPFVHPGQTGPITIAGTTYSGGSMIANPTDGSRYQYGMQLREFWRSGILAFETYCNSAYGGNFETLSAADQVKALTDLTTNTPTSFNDIIPSDFFNEVFFMTWSGFLMDPLYGGNIGMVGWELTGFSGVNMGNFYGEGHTSMQLMLATTPTRLKPASLAQFQAAAKGAGI